MILTGQIKSEQRNSELDLANKYGPGQPPEPYSLEMPANPSLECDADRAKAAF